MIWARRSWAWLALAGIVLGACLISLKWVFLVPVYQSPDEPVHLDYALCLMEHGKLFRASDVSAIRTDRQFNFYLLHPYTHYLMDRCECASITFNDAAKVPPGYGTPEFFQALDRDKPRVESIEIETPPSLTVWYPFGYYALLASWLRLLREFTDSVAGLYFGARSLSVLLLVVNLVFSYSTMRELRLPKGFALLITACVGLFPMTSFVSSYVQPDNLSAALVALAFYLTLRARRNGSLKCVGLLGLSLGALLVTKNHHFLCVAVPATATLVVDRVNRPYTKPGWLVWTGVLAAPSIGLGSIQIWSTWGLNRIPIPFASYNNWLWQTIVTFRKALGDFYTGLTHRSFWGIFGWLDAPLIFGDRFWTKAVFALIQIAALSFVALTVARFAQVSARLLRVYRAGRRREAIRILSSNPVINSYFLFTLLMIALFVSAENFFGAQGRNWFPFLTPIFVTAFAYAPKALKRPLVRKALVSISLAGLCAYTLVGSCFAIETLKQRFYAAGYDSPLKAVSVDVKPVAIHQMKWGDGIGDALGDDSFLAFQLERPQYVRCLRLRYRLTHAQPDRARFKAFWQNSQDSGSQAAEGNVIYQIKTPSDECTMSIWINGVIDQFRLQPDNKPCRIEIRNISLFLDP
jgi:hypothetical protein